MRFQEFATVWSAWIIASSLSPGGQAAGDLGLGQLGDRGRRHPRWAGVRQGGYTHPALAGPDTRGRVGVLDMDRRQLTSLICPLLGGTGPPGVRAQWRTLCLETHHLGLTYPPEGCPGWVGRVRVGVQRCRPYLRGDIESRTQPARRRIPRPLTTYARRILWAGAMEHHRLELASQCVLSHVPSVRLRVRVGPGERWCDRFF